MTRTVLYYIMLISLITGLESAAQVNSKNKNSNSYVTFEITYSPNCPLPDSLTLYFGSNILNDRIEDEYSSKKEVAVNNGHIIKLNVRASEMGYISLIQHYKKGNNRLLDMYFAMPGDDIKLKIFKDQKKGKFTSDTPILTFSGHGYLKYKVQFEANQAGYSDTSVDFAHKLVTSTSVINKYKFNLSPLEADVLTLDQISHIGHMMESQNYIFLEDGHTVKDTADYHYYRPWDLTHISDSAKLISREYPSYALRRASNTYKLYQRPGDVDTAVYHQIIKSVGFTTLKDKLITVFLVKWKFGLKNWNLIFNDALERVATPFYLEKLKALEFLCIGRKAFAFSLADTTGKEVTLNQFKGKTVFIDFWYTGCPNCVNFYKEELLDIEEHFKDNPNVVFISICADKDRKRWLNSISSGQYTSKSVINLYTNGRGFNDPLIKYYRITGYPHPMVIDKNGKLFSSFAHFLRHKKTAIPILEKALNIKQE